MTPFVGIIGGMGALAGARLVNHALTYSIARGATKDADFPKLLYFNLPSVGLNESGLVDARTAFQKLRVAVSQMESFGCHRLVIACNSIHAFYAKLQDMCSIPIVNIVEVGCRVAGSSYQSIGVLCSASSRKEHLFDKFLERRGVAACYIEQERQDGLNAVIGRAITAANSRVDIEFLRSAAVGLQSKGAECILLGCTELGLVFTPELTPLPIVDCGCSAIEEALSLG